MGKPGSRQTSVPSSGDTGSASPLPKPAWLLAAALVLAVIFAFSPILTNQFVNFDDRAYVTANAHVQNGLTLQNLRWAFTTIEASNWHPLTWLSHMLDCQIYGLRPWGHHLTSLLLHAVNALLVFYFFYQVSGALWPAFFVAALFALHPLRVESVAWVAERKDVLSTFFFLLSLHAYSRYARHVSVSTRFHLAGSGLRWYGLALLLFTLGLLSKPMVVSLPFVLLLLDYWPIGRFRPDRWKQLLIEKIPFFVIAAASCAITMTVQVQSTKMLDRLTTFDRLENAVVAYARYLEKTFWPVRLAVFYPHPGAWPPATVGLSCLLLLLVSIWAFRRRKSIPAFAIGWLWFLLTLVPVIGLIQVGRQSIADRYMYIPSIGLFMGLVGLADGLSSGFPRRKLLFTTVGIGFLIVCAGLTYHQATFWKNAEILFRRAIGVTEGNYLAHSNLGDALRDQGRMEDAIREYRAVLAIRPAEVTSRNNLGSLFLDLNRIDEAIEQFRLVLRDAPGFAEAHNNLGYAFQKKGDQPEAMREFQAALKLNPNDFRVHLNLASVLLAQGNADQAISELKAALTLEPGDLVTHISLANLLFNAGRIDEALVQFESAARLAPANAEVQANLGMALARKGRNDEAIVHLREALRLQPVYPEAQAALRALSSSP